MKIAVIGCGNMASAIVLRVHEENESIQFYCYTPTKIKAETLANKVNGVVCDTLNDFPKDIEYWIIACKPQQVDDLAREFKYKSKNIISILAGTTTKKLGKIFNTDKIIRVMPSTPSEIGMGISLLFFTESITQKLKNEMTSLFKACGMIIELEDEDRIGPLTVFTGSGPGFLFHIASIFESELTKLGFKDICSKEVISQLFKGVGNLYSDKKLDALTLQKQVTSKAGVTEAGIESFKQQKLDQIIEKSLKSALIREKELGK